MGELLEEGVRGFILGGPGKGEEMWAWPTLTTTAQGRRHTGAAELRNAQDLQKPGRKP